MDLPMELSIFEILRRDIIAASELLGSAVGATSPHQMLMVRMCPLSPPPSHHHRIQMRPLMHLEHRKPANAALDDLLVVIVCDRVVQEMMSAVGGVMVDWSILSGVWAARCEPWWGFQFWSGTRSIFRSFS